MEFTYNIINLLCFCIIDLFPINFIYCIYKLIYNASLLLFAETYVETTAV